ncbi:PEP-CTERM sorting domain-containing protein [Tsuneonella sp. SYSU-LHT278]|uniref:PEP-CTERM sorting domain-containing protein n=1 Tax=Tsuneonella sediminis TaxID=3416089 RepID=UPI003F7B070C
MRISGFLLLASIATPAQAAQAMIPEPSTLALFGIGVLGVIIGRHGSRRRRD